MAAGYERGITVMYEGTGRERYIQSRRINRNDTFMTVVWFQNPNFAPRWSIWDLSGPSGEILDMGKGRPPEHHLPPGMKFSATIPDKWDGQDD
jgi:hypothetical protein